MSIERYAKQAYSAYRHVVLREAVKREFYTKWEEQKHPRADDGRFGEKSGENSRHPTQVLWDLLLQGKIATPAKHDPDLIREAAEVVKAASNYQPGMMDSVPFKLRGAVERYRRRKMHERFQHVAERYAAWKEADHPRAEDGKFGDKSGVESESRVSRKSVTRKEVATAAQKAGYFPNKFPGRTGDGMRIEVGDGFIKKNPHTGKWDTFSSDEVRSSLGLDGGGEGEGSRSFRKTTGTSGAGYQVGQLIRDPDGKLWTVTKTGRPVGFSDGLSTGRSADSGYEHTAHARPATDEEAKAGKIAELRHKLSLPGPSDDRDRPAHDDERKRWDAELRQSEGRLSAEDEASQKAKQDEDRKPALMADALSQLDIDRDAQVPDADGDMEDARDWSAITRALYKVKGKSFSIAGIKGMSDAELRALLES